ncbi:type I polyketide synthase [Nocardia sp. NPDC060259]|uniref:type I polyketide synthase n=1 Tax=Nocardia sp. NPDC060259 TaxID=3347088 RepID=UPI00366283D2
MANEQQLRDNLRWVTTELHRTRQQLAETHSRTAEPVAIVGMSCRFPGGIDSPEQLWRTVADGVDAVSALPADRGWDLDSLYDPEPGRPGKLYARAGGFLTGIDLFDAGFFGISPREAAAMDPQHRILLETSWEAFEAAGLDADALRGTDTGVFIGAAGSDYRNLAGASGDAEGHLLTGNAASVASGRIAYSFGLEGPAVTIDTACSSSLVALHLAAQSLRRGECGLALAAGATVIATPTVLVELARQQVLAEDGRCRAYDSDAAGMGWGEGVGVLVLERLSDARRNGHPVLAVVPGSAVNQDGASNGLSAPSGPAQQRVIAAALADAGLTAAHIDVVEGHGTGTRLGDPIEVGALLATYGQDREGDRPLLLGSVKSNIGHTQAAAGMAGVIKMVQAIRHGLAPRTLHVAEPTSQVDWSAGAVRLLTETTSWPAVDRPRRAGVSAFGISGTNAHVIIEQDVPEAEPNPRPAAVAPIDTPLLPWVVSARDERALEASARNLTTFTGEDAPSVADTGVSLATTRTGLEHRAVVLAADPAGFRAGLDAVSEGGEHVGVTRGRAEAPSGVVFVFPGQGTQWQGMAAGLLESAPVFREQFAECEQALSEYLDYSPAAVLRGDPGAPALDRIDVVQPVLFAVMVSLARLWRAFGVHPAAVVGHSQGEVAAACVAGALSLGDAARVVGLRARAWARLSGQGTMASVALPVERIRPRLERFDGLLAIAAVNSPVQVAVTGDPGALSELLDELNAEGVRSTVLRIGIAAHSAQIDPLRDRLLTDLAPVAPRTSDIPFYSTVTGGLIETATMDAGYWFRNVRQPVLFEAAVRSLVDAGYQKFLELGPHPALGPAITETADAAGVDPLLLTSLRRQEGGPERFLTALAEAHVAGVPVDWSTLFAARQASRTSLPTYPFVRTRYWLDAKPAPERTATQDQRDAQEFWSAVDDGDLEAITRTLVLTDDQIRDWGAVLPTLSQWRKNSVDGSTVDQWRYAIRWRPGQVEPRSSLHGTWLAVVPSSAAARRLADEVVAGLGARGAEVIAVEPADLLAALGDHEVSGVLLLTGLDEQPSTLEPVVPEGLARTHDILRSLADAGIDTRLWCVTSGAVSIGRSDRLRRPLQAAHWGFGVVAALEFPDLWQGLVDLPEQVGDRALDRLAGLLVAPGDEDQVAIRDSAAFVRRMVRQPRPEPEPDGGSWQPRGTILVTGGTGAIGAQVARRLAAEGAEQLVLVSRHGAEPADPALRGDIESLGATVTFASCDVADRAALAALLDQLPTLNAVVHLAGVAQDRPLAEMTSAEFAAVFAAKGAGAGHLDELLAGRSLDAFILFSSGAASWGSARQAAYAAANAYVDALAQHRRQRGERATAIAWGGWAGGGMVDDAAAARARRLGLRLMAPELALRALREALDDQETTLTVADLDWDRFAPTFTAVRPSPLLEEIPEVVHALRDRETGAPTLDTATLTTAERHTLLLATVCAEVAAVLGHTSSDMIGPDQAFKDLGLDSLTAIELRNRLGSALGLRLPATLVFDHPTPESVARYLLGEVPGKTPATRTPAAAADEPLAIIGMSCRFPGGVASPEDLWQLLIDGVDAVGSFPVDRGWDLEQLYDPAGERPGTSYVNEGAFLADAGGFDADFFGISPREAAAMDPQQRLLLETSWEVLERSGIDPTSLRGSDTGVFVGGASHDYAAQLVATPAASDGYALTGSAAAVMSGRIAYQLGLEGPAVTVDTACSSSLVAMHLAGQALHRGECSLALVGAAAVLSTPAGFVEFSRQGGLARDGRCRPFDRDASGTGWGEGVGFLALERLSDARRNGHRVLAVVRGSAVNSDGASNGLTAPNGPSQQRVIRQALAASGLTPSDIDAVEAHGTATTLGDPIEAQALLAVYGQDRAQPLLLGSMKSNIGHTQAAAGIAGVIKMVLALRNSVIPKTLHLTEPTPQVDWSSGAVDLVAENTEWPDTGRIRRAGVSAFGVSGTNAHLIIEQAPREPEQAHRDSGSALLPWLLSGRTEQALRNQARNLLATKVGYPLDAAATLAAGRAHFEHRVAILAQTSAELREGLTALAAGHPAPGALFGEAVRGRLVLLFSGQGTQRAGMGRALYARFPAFADAFDAVCAHLDQRLERPLRDVVFTDAQALDRTEYAQPALFALEVALYRLFEHWGLKPDAVLGHSVGEIAAAHVAGVLTLADAARLVAARGRLMQQLPTGGAMLAVRAGEDQIRALFGDRLDIAAVNAADSIVLSGDEIELTATENELIAQGIRVRRLNVSHAFHSALMDPMLAAYADICASVDYAPPMIPFISAVSGAQLSATEACSPDYWLRNVRETVRFADAVRSAAGQGEVTFLEFGPDSTLSALAQECTGAPSFAVMRADHAEERTVLTALCGIHGRGGAVDWPRYFGGSGAEHADLPTYAFQHQRFWLEPAAAPSDAVGLGFDTVAHPLLGAALSLSETNSWLFSARLSPTTTPWLAEHVIDGVALLPGTALLELAAAAGARLGCAVVEELTLEAPVLLHTVVRIQLSVGPAQRAEGRPFTVHFRADDAPAESWTKAASGLLSPNIQPAPEFPAQWPPADAEPLPVADYHARAEQAGLGYGHAFRGLRAVWQRGSELFAEATLPEGVDESGYCLHPALLDAALRAPTMVDDGRVDERLLPFAWRGVRLYGAGARDIRVRITTSAPHEVAIAVADSTGRPVLAVDGLVSRTMSPDLVDSSRAGDSLFELRWVPASTAVPTRTAPSEFLEFDSEPGVDDLISRSHDAVRDAVQRLQAWLSGNGDAATRLVVATRRAVATRADEDVLDLTHAPLWGLLRSVQAEYPGRVVLVDLDDTTALPEITLPDDEPQLAIRSGAVLVPRLTPIAPAPNSADWDATGTVLVTGATGGLGELVVRHLAARHGIRSFVLASRRGAAAEGAAELLADLADQGVEVRLVDCDIADRAAVADLVSRVPEDMPLRGVVHIAGIVADGLFEALTPDRVDEVLRPKLDAAVHLHELTRDADLSRFVLFSSTAGIFGTAGQANYAAANAFLDALAHHRRARGLPAVAVAWGPWGNPKGMTGGLSELDLERIRRGGLAPLADAEGMTLFDASASGTPSVVAAKLDRGWLRAGSATTSSLLSELTPAAPRPMVAEPIDPVDELKGRLSELGADEQLALLVALVQAETGSVLGHTRPFAIGANRPFSDVGIDSLASVELRNRLNAATGLRLPATLVFDFPTPAALADYMATELVEKQPTVTEVRLSEFDRLVAELISTTTDPGAHSALETRLNGALNALRELKDSGGDSDLATVSGDELLSIIDAEFG